MSKSDTPRTDELNRVYGQDDDCSRYAMMREHCEDLERELSACQRRCAELEKDTARYAWLRGHNDSMSIPPALTVAIVREYELEAWCVDDLDSAIDAALAAQEPSK